MTTETQTATEQSGTAATPAMTASLMRSVNLAVTTAQIDAATTKRLQQMSKTVKIDGFRPGKVPVAKVKQMYGDQASWEALNDQVGEQFAKHADAEKLRVAGMPKS